MNGAELLGRTYERKKFSPEEVNHLFPSLKGELERKKGSTIKLIQPLSCRYLQ